MAPVLWEIDPTSESASNVPFVLVNNTTWFVLEQELAPPEFDRIYATSADTEGDPLVSSRPRNRVIRLKLEHRATSAVNLETALYQLQQKLGKLRAEGGTLKYTTPTTDTIIFDAVAGTYRPNLSSLLYTDNAIAEIDVEFECDPYGRGAPVTLNDHPESSAPYLVFTETEIVGDVPALGKLVIDEDDGDDQKTVWWGLQSRYYDAAATAGLFFEAEGRTLQGGASIVTLSGASGGGSNNAVRITVPAGDSVLPVSMLSTQATGGGAHLSHVGSFRVLARVQRESATAGDILVGLEWSEGDFRNSAQKTPVRITTYAANQWLIADLGVVTLEKAAQGTQRWEGRIVVQPDGMTTNTNFAVDYLLLLPVDEGSGIARSVPRSPSATTFTGLDTFPSGAGALNGRTAQAGGNWATNGSGADFTQSAGAAQRTAVSDANGSVPTLGRVAQLGSAITDMTVEAFVSWSVVGGLGLGGILARYVDSSNYAWFTIQGTGGVFFSKVVAGTATTLYLNNNILPIVAAETYKLRVTIDSTGRYYLYVTANSALPVGDPLFQGYDAVFATGGALASGKGGIFDWWRDSTASTRSYTQFQVWAPARDAAMFANQSLEIRHDQVIREDSAGAVWQRVSSYEGDHLLIPPAGREARTTRIIVKASRAPAGQPGDIGIDDISARLTYTPRFLVVPS